MTEQIERQELWCHDCERYVQFAVDVSLNGNHVLNCPNCGHEHCRVVRDGKITDIRWDSHNRSSAYRAAVLGSTTTSTYTSYATVTSSTSATGTPFLYQAWFNAGSV